MSAKEPKRYPAMLNWMTGWKWGEVELQALLKGAERKLLETRQQWSATTDDQERARLHRRILGLAGLIEDLRFALKGMAQDPPETPKPPDSPA